MDSEIKHIINKVFEITSVKLEPTDPLVAVLLMQYSFINDVASKLKTDQLATNGDFINLFTTKADELIDAINRLEKNRQALLIEILEKNEEKVNQLENCVYARLKWNFSNISTNNKEITIILYLSIFFALCCAVGSIFSIFLFFYCLTNQ